ncbi:MAG TPA: AMP-binding protein [Pseudonocardiaceae bacterium]|nr:AMP-binding protein [Pseudonocardiaceae bacterium]
MKPHPDARLVVAASGQTLTGPELQSAVDDVADRLAALPPGLVLAAMPVTLTAVLRYLGALRAGRAIALIDPSRSADALVTCFRPAAVLGADPLATPPAGYTGTDLAGPAWRRRDPEGVAPHRELAVLLPTSGSTGSPKFVRLSRAAITANATAIADVLGIGRDDVAPTSLPLHYSYGMSVLNSHLLRGATVVVEDSGLLSRSFWQAVADYRITSLAGVPHHYRMLHRLRFDPAEHPTLRTLTQAGGALPAELIAHFHETMSAVGGRLFVMYGQTEAGPRMATLLADEATLGSVGPALPGGRFTIRGPDGTETDDPGVTGEVVYTGPGVMLGYAATEADLARGDDNHGVLATGDLGHLDTDGRLWLTGRLARIGKVFGHRVSLDDLEQLVRTAGLGLDAVGAVPAGDRVTLYVEGADQRATTAAARALAGHLRMHVSGFDVRGIESLPLLSSGKIDYRALEAQ